MSRQVQVAARPARPPSALQLRRTHRHAQSFHVAPDDNRAGTLVQMALKQHRTLPGSTDEPSEPTCEQHHATSPPPRPQRRAATPLPLEHTLQRCTAPPPRVNHSREQLAREPRSGPPAPRSTRCGCRHRRAHSMPCPGKSKSRHGRRALLPHSSCAAHIGTRSPSTSPQTTTALAPLWSLQMALKQQRALPGSTDEPFEPTREQHH